MPHISGDSKSCHTFLPIFVTQLYAAPINQMYNMIHLSNQCIICSTCQEKFNMPHLPINCTLCRNCQENVQYASRTHPMWCSLVMSFGCLCDHFRFDLRQINNNSNFISIVMLWHSKACLTHSKIMNFLCIYLTIT